MNDMYFGNMSTDLEVKTLLETYRTAQEGTLITHAEISALAQLNVDSTRYRTVTNRWRKIMLSQFNIELRARAGVGFVVLPPSERVTANIGDGLRLFKRMDNTVGRLKKIPRQHLETEETVRLDHATLLMARVSDTARQAKAEIAPPKPHRLLVDRKVPETEA